MKVLVAGAGGFIGGHLVKGLMEKYGYQGVLIRAVDKKPISEWYQVHEDAENLCLDLSKKKNCVRATEQVSQVYNLAADMGGIGFIENFRVECMRSVLINTNLIEAAYKAGAKKYFYSSSACAYNTDLQKNPEIIALKESDAYPAMAERGYGWEKLYSEMVCQEYWAERGMETYIARFHNVMGPCYDDKTEVLTDSGFKFFKDILYRDKIATLEDGEKIKYYYPSAIQNYEYSGDMYKFKSKKIDLFVTPDHNMYIKKSRNAHNFELKKMKDIVDYKRWIFKRNGNWEGENIDVEVIEKVNYSDGRSMSKRNGEEKKVPIDLWLKFFGWYLSEGSCFKTNSNYIINISQKDKKNRKEILSLIEKIGYSYYIYDDINIIINSKQLYEKLKFLGHSYEKFIPKKYLNLDKKILYNLFETMMKGDGHKKRKLYTTVSKQLADDFQEMLFKLGYNSNIRMDEHKYKISFDNNVDTSALNCFIEQYNGRVYDVTVPNHIIFVRRDGKTCWSGNCETWDGGREKAPAAISRKVIDAVFTDSKEIEIWGDGTQTRSFMWVGDCIKGILKIVDTNELIATPINLGSSELISIDDLVSMAEDIAGVKLNRKYKLDAPKGVAGRNSDNTFIKSILGWEPDTPLRKGMEITYEWIKKQYEHKYDRRDS